MSDSGKRYAVTIGMSIVPEGCAFADFGLRYGDADLSVVSQIEALFNEHAEDILKAMKPMRDQLVQIGVTMNPPPGGMPDLSQGKK